MWFIIPLNVHIFIGGTIFSVNPVHKIALLLPKMHLDDQALITCTKYDPRLLTWALVTEKG